MNAKYWLLIAVVAGLVGWAGVETQRLVAARKQLAASRELEKSVNQRVEVAHSAQPRALVPQK